MKQKTGNKNYLLLKPSLTFKIFGVFAVVGLVLAGIVGVTRTASTVETISGYVFLDYDGDGNEESVDVRPPVITVNVYSDENSDGVLDSGDKILGSGLTDENGNYFVDIDYVTTTIRQKISIDDDDVEEFSSGEMNMGSNDLEMIYDGSEKQKIGIRFAEVNLPPAANISSAKLRFHAKDASSAGNTLTIYGEKSKDSDPFYNVYHNLSPRIKTQASVTWNTGSWTQDAYYDTPELTAVIREVMDAPGWIPGNPITFIIEGNTGTKKAHAGTNDGPELRIDYTLPNKDYIVAVDINCLRPGSIIHGVAIDKGSTSNVVTRFSGQAPHCYAISDVDPNHLVYINRFSGKNIIPVGGGQNGVNNIEAIAFDPISRKLYATDKEQLGTINLTTGLFTPTSNEIGYANGSQGEKDLNDPDGLSFDPITGELWATHRRGSDPDLLFQINPETGAFVPDVFGPGVDYVEIVGLNLFENIDDFGIDARTGIFYGINVEDNGDHEFLVEIDKKTGLMTLIDTIEYAGRYLTDIEGAGFTNFGQFLLTTGKDGDDDTNNLLFSLDLETGQATRLGRFSSGGDYEACDCLTSASNQLEGTVFYDQNNSGTFDNGESVFSNVKINIYLDTYGEGLLDPTDILVDSMITDEDGAYSWETGASTSYVMGIAQGYAPKGFKPTTPPDQGADFSTGFGGVPETGNDFGFIDAAFAVSWVYVSAEWEGSTALIKWGAEAIQGNDYFMVERTTGDGIFESLEKVPFQGSYASLREFDYLDKQAGSSGVPKLYYRIKQVDMDGSFSYSQVVELNLDKAENFLKISRVYPNPASGQTRISYRAPGTGEMSMRVIDMSGKVKYEKAGISGGNADFSLDVSNWSPGMYMIQLYNEEMSDQKKLLVR